MSQHTNDDAIYRQLFNHHHDVMLLIDYQAGFIVDANVAASKFYGYPVEQLRGMNVSRINVQDESELQPQRKKAIAGDENTFIFDHRLANGDIRTVEVHISPITHNANNFFFSIIHDITEQKKHDELIHDLAFCDDLTKLPNRRLFNDRLTQTIAARKRDNQSSALLMIDLDNFKPLNDKYGHSVGDLLLIEVSKRLKSAVREVDTVARFGGDEFIVILGGDKILSTTEVATVADKILTILAKPHRLTINHFDQENTQINYQCTSSIGAILFNDQQRSQNDIINLADLAMYEAKLAGGN